MLSAWNFDANSIRPIDISDTYIDTLLVTNPVIIDYLDIERDSKYFIVAPKGYGKTLLMKAKSHKIRSKSKAGSLYIPQGQLCENLSTYKPRISLEEINQFKDRQIWEEIWQMCFLVLIIKRHSPEQLPDEVASLFGRAEEIDEILHIILANRRRLYKMRHIVPSILMPLFREINIPVYVFIDNIDESCLDFISQYRMFDDKSYLVWINAQLGGMVAAKEMCLKNKHVKIYLSIRSEAYDYFNDSSQTQMRNFCTILNYSKTELRNIFEKNILFSDESRLLNTSYADPLSNFLGIQKIEHRFVKNDDGLPRTEDIFDFIYRHTLGRPRELVLMGSYLSGVKPIDREPEKISELINEVSGLILAQYKSEVFFDYEYTAYDAFCRAIQSNVIPKSEIGVINSEVLKNSQYEDVCSLLYRIGLLGWVEKKVDKDDSYIQQFNKVSQKIFTPDSNLHNSPAYILHSCVDRDLKKIHNNRFYNPQNIIGPGYPFRLKIDDSNVISLMDELLAEARQALKLKNYNKVDKEVDSSISLAKKGSVQEKEALADIYIECGDIYNSIATKVKPKTTIKKMVSAFQDAANILLELISEDGNSQIRPDLLIKAKKCFTAIHTVDSEDIYALNGLQQCAVIEGDYEKAISLQKKIEEIESALFFEINTKTPYTIEHIKVTNVSIFETIKWSASPKMNVLLGRNGFGKSHLLRLIACMLKADKLNLTKDYFHHGNRFSKVTIGINDTLKVSELQFYPQNYTENASSDIPDDLLENRRRYYLEFKESDLGFNESRGTFPLLAIPDNRFLDKSGSVFENRFNKKGALRFGSSLLNSGSSAFINQDSIRNNIEEILFSIAIDCLIEQSKRGGLEANIHNVELATLIQEVFRQLTNTSFVFHEVVPLGRAKSSLKIMVRTEGNTVAIPLQKASQGTLSVISMIGLIYYYLGQLYDFRKHKGPEYKITHEKAVVFIEEIDAHLHPSWQQRIVTLLRSLFPNVQFFVTSHSPLVVAGCKEKEVSVLMKSEDNCFQLEQIENDFIGWTTAELYNHDVFDIEEYDDMYLYYSIAEKNEEKLMALLNELSAKGDLTNEEQNAKNRALSQMHYIQIIKKKRQQRHYVTNLIMENARLKTLIESEKNK